MNLRALYVSKLAKCPLTCLADLAGDLGATNTNTNTNTKREASFGSLHCPCYYSDL
jgi:hypothetical protein